MTNKQLMDLVRDLATDSDVNVRCAVAEHPLCPKGILAELQADENATVRLLASRDESAEKQEGTHGVPEILKRVCAEYEYTILSFDGVSIRTFDEQTGEIENCKLTHFVGGFIDSYETRLSYHIQEDNWVDAIEADKATIRELRVLLQELMLAEH